MSAASPEPSAAGSPSTRSRASRTASGRAATGRTASARAGAARAPRVRTRARQGPRRDAQRTTRRRHPLRDDRASGPRGAAARAARAARATGGALGLSTARRAALLAVVVCALALTVAVPLRNYVTQRHEIAAVSDESGRLGREVSALTAERGALDDPAHIEALARERLGYARPGETPYRVQLPGAAGTAETAGAAGAGVVGASGAPVEAELPWYTRLSRETLGTRP